MPLMTTDSALTFLPNAASIRFTSEEPLTTDTRIFQWRGSFAELRELVLVASGRDEQNTAAPSSPTTGMTPGPFAFVVGGDWDPSLDANGSYFGAFIVKAISHAYSAVLAKAPDGGMMSTTEARRHEGRRRHARSSTRATSARTK